LLLDGVSYFANSGTSSSNVWVVIRAIQPTKQTIKTGNGFLSSAISGARIVRPLAKIWHVPMAVALFLDGKRVISLNET